MSNLHIVTVANESKYYLPYLKQSCEKNGKKLEILGYGEEWKGFNWKFRLVKEYLYKLDKDDIVCFVDGYDVICLRNLKELPKTFFELKKKYNCKIITGECKIAIPNILINKCMYLFSLFYCDSCNNKLLNSGTYIGQVKDLILMLEQIRELSPNDSADDQVLLTKYCKKNNNDIYIDTENELFLTLFNPYSEIDNCLNFKNNKVYYNNNSPFFLHGSGETYLDNTIIKLNYDYDYNNKVNTMLKNDFYKKYLFRLQNSNFFKSFFLIIIIIVVIFIIYKYTIKNNSNKSTSKLFRKVKK